MIYFQIYAWSDCNYCNEACKLLTEQNMPFIFSCIDNSDALMDVFKKQYEMTTVPIIILKNTSNPIFEQFIGGFTELQAYLHPNKGHVREQTLETMVEPEPEE